MSEVLDLLKAPAERELPPGHLEQRKQILLAAIGADAESTAAAAANAHRPLGARLRRIVSWLGCLMVVAVISAGATRTSALAAHVDRGHVAEIAAVVGAGTTICLHAAPARRANHDVVLQHSSAMTYLAVWPL